MGSPLRPDIVKVTNWQMIANDLLKFPPPTLTLDDDGELLRNAWVFRGVSSAEFKLEPGIERCAVRTPLKWPALEIDISEDFKSRANLYLAPPSGGELGWLALMQHYGIPTRLLDFTFSPFVGLYFAVKPSGRASRQETPEFTRLWAIDSNAVHNASLRSIARARIAARTRSGVRKGGRVSLHPDDFASDRDTTKTDAE